MISAGETAFRLKLLLQQHTVTLTGMLLTERQTSPALARMRKLAQPPSRPGPASVIDARCADRVFADDEVAQIGRSGCPTVPPASFDDLDQGHRRR